MTPEDQHQKPFSITIDETSIEYRAAGTTKAVFKGCKRDMWVRPWVKTDKGRHFVVTAANPPPGYPSKLTVLRARIEKEGNPVVILYTRVNESGEEIYPQTALTGIFDATYKQAREMLAHAKEIRPYIPKGKRPTKTYKEYIDRWEAGESYRSLRAEWRKDNPKKDSKLFYRAFYRRDTDFFSKEPKKQGVV